MFETFNVPAMYVAIQAVLSLYASGRTTGKTPIIYSLPDLRERERSWSHAEAPAQKNKNKTKG